MKREGGTIILSIKPQIKQDAPIAKHHPFCLQLSLAHLKAIPPYYTSNTYTIKVKQVISRNIQLLKNPSKTLYSLDPNFLEFIWLKICKKTND